LLGVIKLVFVSRSFTGAAVRGVFIKIALGKQTYLAHLLAINIFRDADGG
jgi:hypothetical protein